MDTEALRARVEELIRRHDLIAPGGDVTCLVSGGADSTCLWHVLTELGYRVSALHVNHGLRGDASDEDARFCAERFGAEVVDGGGGLTEDDWRKIRYSFATDRQFLGTAQLNMAALGTLSQDYLQGDAKADDVIEQADSAVTSLLNTNPSDPSLSKTQKIMRAMFLEYGRAIRADKHHRDPGQYIYRAYGLANFAHDVLSQAEPALAKRGCDVSPLL